MRTKRRRCASPPAPPGKPKGVVYSHRALVLHSLAACIDGTFGISNTTTVLLACSSMFHANGWGIPYTAVDDGRKAGFSRAARSTRESLLDLIEQEGVTLATGVPTLLVRRAAGARK